MQGNQHEPDNLWTRHRDLIVNVGTAAALLGILLALLLFVWAVS